MTELFEKYYTKALAKDERIDFENKIKSDMTFAQDYNAFVMMMEHLESKDDINSALSNLNEIHNEVKSSKPGLSIRYIRYLAAAIILPLLAYTLYFITSNNNSVTNSKEAFAANFQPAPISLTTKGIDNEKILAQINLDYNAERHSKVINALNQINIDSIGESRLYLMLGSSYLVNGRYKQAREALLPLETNSQFKNEFYWYTALSYLGENDGISAKLLLQNIPEESNYYSKAKSILEIIDSL